LETQGKRSSGRNHYRGTREKVTQNDKKGCNQPYPQSKTGKDKKKGLLSTKKKKKEKQSKGGDCWKRVGGGWGGPIITAMEKPKRT